MPVKVASPFVKQAMLSVIEPARGGFVEVHPRYRAWLAKLGLVNPEAFFELPGEIVSGHAGRNVARVELGRPDRVAWLKREHTVSFKVKLRNWRAGFGFRSRSEREAAMLIALDRLALPSPNWIAFGCDRRGRAFLLVDDLAGFAELREIARTCKESARRREYARELGYSLAEVHAARITTPDLAAKHVFVNPDTGRIALVDWPTARRDRAATFSERARWFAQLDASLAGELASGRDRLRVLRAYCKRSWGQPKLRDWLAAIRKQKTTLKQSSSIRDQLCDLQAPQRLVWKADDEAACVVPEMAAHWPEPAVCAPFYESCHIESGRECVINAPDGRGATLLRYRSFAPISRLFSWIRGKPWRSPALKQARMLFRKQRMGQAAPKLLAFGQKRRSLFAVDSFVLFRKGSEAPC